MTGGPTGGLLHALEEAARHARDIDHLAALIRAEPGVQAVEVSNYLVKTEPPMREVVVKFRSAASPTLELIADITLHHDGTLSVRGLHDAGEPRR